MKDSNEAIERVLAGLRDVEAPAGMERRVLAAMEERTAARTGWRPALGWVLACGVVAMVVAGTLMLRPSRVPAQTKAVVAVHAPVAVPARVGIEQKRNTEILRFAQNDLRFRRVQQVRPVEVAATAKVEEERGFPAPPMPLTEEEKLLVRVAHRVDPQELTPLNAEARERQAAAFDEEFMEFFAVPETVTDEKQMNPNESEKGETR